MPGGRASRQKGDRGEREFAKLMGGERVPLSGSQGGSFSGDVDVPYLGRGEVKRRRNGFATIYKWLEDRDFLALRSDRQEWLVVMRAEDVKMLIDELDALKIEHPINKDKEFGISGDVTC